jgi:hypothetical protein
MRLKTSIPELGDPKTYLTAPAAAAATALTVKNNSEFTANDYIIIGKPGQEGSSLHKVSTLTNKDTINIAGDALNFAIATNTPIYFIKYNQVKFLLGDYSARYYTGTISATKNSAVITGSGTDWSAIDVTYALLINGKWYDLKSVDSATQITLTTKYTDEDITSSDYALIPFTVQTTVDIAADQLETIWDDTDALAEDYYRSQYYNETTTILSGYSSIIAAAEMEGYSDFALNSLENQVLSDLRDKEAKRRTRDEIDTDINDAIRELVNTIISDVLEDYLSSYDTIDIKSGRSEYPLFDDFRKLSAIWISDGSTYHRGLPMKIGDDLPNVDYNASEPYYYLRDNVVGIRPEPVADVTDGIKIWYERRVPSLKYPGDELPYLLRDYKRVIVAYALSKGSDDKNDASRYTMEFMQGKQDMISDLGDRDLSTNKSVEIVNDGDLFT